MNRKKRNLLVSVIIMCSFFIVAFKFGPNWIKWFWTGQETIPVVLGIVVIILLSILLIDLRKKNTAQKKN